MTNSKATTKKALQQAEEAYQEAKNQAVKLVDAAKIKLEDAKDKSTDALHDVKDKAGELHDEIFNYVKENPVKTISAAALVALIAGFVTRIKK